MNLKWIDCNLPFDTITSPDYPPMPDMDMEFRKEFGDQFGEFNIPYVLITCQTLVENNIDNIAVAQEIAVDILEKKEGEGTRIDYDNDEHVAVFSNALMPWFGHNKKDVGKVITFRKYRKHYGEWFENQPLIVEWKNELNKRIEENDKLSFCGNGFNKPGTLIEVDIEGELKIFLIGHINTSGGICDDCTEFSGDRIVKRYAVAMSFEE
jgi:hypothetical protein